MKPLLLIALLSTVILAADKPQDHAAQDRQKLQGTWQVLEERHGDADPNEEGTHCQLIFDGDKFTVKKDDKAILEGTFQIDPTKSPPRIDIKVLKDEDNERIGQSAEGIFQLDGDKLKWCSCEPGQDERPTEFSTKGTRFLLLTMERAKK